MSEGATIKAYLQLRNLANLAAVLHKGNSMTNPLLNVQGLPTFSEIKPEHVEPAVEQLIASGREKIKDVLASAEGKEKVFTWNNLIDELDAEDDLLNQAWGPVSHMNSVVNTDELRDAYNACLPKLSEYSTEVGQNKELFSAYKSLIESDDFSGMDMAQQKILENAMRDFKLSGIDLPEEKQKRYGELRKELSSLTSKYSENVLDATQAWSKHVTDEADLSGLPETALAAAAQLAKDKELEGFAFSLDYPSFYPILTYCDNRELRAEVYQAFCTKASDQGPDTATDAGKDSYLWNNSELMNKILAARHELAQLLDYNNYGEYSLATKMAEDVAQVVTFLTDLAEKALPKAKAEFAELEAFVKDEHGVDQLEAWDIGYYSEKLQQAKYAISDETLRPYFPINKVISGMFTVVNKLYGINIKEEANIDVWHEDARYFTITDADDNAVGGFYIDVYARDKKRGGAWMDECKVRHQNLRGELELPVAYLVCNFNQPIGDKPALLTHNEVTTMFHEFGHGLHHMLTKVKYSSVSGINGVAWDAVELPSQFMENWCWQKEAIPLFSEHYETGEALPDDLLEKMLAAKNFQAAMQMVRQIEFSLFDMRIHTETTADQAVDIQAILDEVRAQVSVIKPPVFNRFQNSFSHIFAGGYSAGYYSYKWAEVLSADAFSRFEDEGIFNRETGLAFKAAILEMGGSKDPMELFVDFMGRKPTVDAVLRQDGII